MKNINLIKEKTPEEDFRFKKKWLSCAASGCRDDRARLTVITKKEEGDEILMPVGVGRKDRAREIISRVDFRKLYRGGTGEKQTH